VASVSSFKGGFSEGRWV